MREFDASFVLRVWKDGKGDDAWRASLKELKSQEIAFFANLDDLTRYLKDSSTVKQILMNS